MCEGQDLSAVYANKILTGINATPCPLPENELRIAPASLAKADRPPCQVFRQGRTIACTLRRSTSVQNIPCENGANGMDPAAFGRRPLEDQFRKRRNTTQIVRIGLDLAKNVFEVHGVDAHDKAILQSHRVKNIAAGCNPSSLRRVAALRRWNGGL